MRTVQRSDSPARRGLKTLRAGSLSQLQMGARSSVRSLYTITPYGQVTVRSNAEFAGVSAGTKVETETLSPRTTSETLATLISPPVVPTMVAPNAHALTFLLNVTTHCPVVPGVAETGPALPLELKTLHSELTIAELLLWLCRAVMSLCSLATWLCSVAIRASSASTRSSRAGSPPACDSPPPPFFG